MNNLARLLGSVALSAVIATTVVLAQTGHDAMKHEGQEGHGASDAAAASTSTSPLTEPGQGAFAVLSELVVLLEADPATDWTKVDLTALREHLVDMDRVAVASKVVMADVPGGLRASATGDVRTIAALQRMVPAHAAELAKDERWSVEATKTADGVDLTVTSKDPKVVQKIRALGFFGLMASQDHHRNHHLGMATGKMVHLH
ncbi:hypothetical protein N9H93_01610 [Rhizobiaceae bacterium]|nr:hypothetical protein [Rhizobiaceae bacterium]